MSFYPAQNPLFILNDKAGRPITGGRVYIGVAGMDPEVNPIPVYWDNGTTPATQPLKIKGGYIVNGTNPATPYLPENYSIRAYDALGGVVFYVANMSGSIAAQLAASSGAAHVGFNQSGSGAATRTVQDKLRETVSVNDFGALGDSATDDTAAVNKAVLALALRGGGRVIFGAVNGFYKVNGPVYLPSNITIDLNGQTLKGAGSTTGSMFETATLQAGALVSNIGSPPETKLVQYAGLCNGRIENVGKVCNFYNFIFGCSVRDIASDNCLQFGVFSRCFYMQAVNCTNRGTNAPGFYAFDFTGANNAIQLLRCSATKGNAFRITGGGANFSMMSCSTEGGSGSAIRVENDQTLVVLDHYAEAWSGTVFDFSAAGTCIVEIANTWLNSVDTAFQDADGAVLIGTWRSSNRIVNIGAAPNRGRMNVSGSRNFIHFEYSGDQNDIWTTLPNWTMSKNTNFHALMNFNADGVADIRAKTNYWKNSIIPLNYMGDVGAPFPGQVQFSTVTYPTGGAVTLTILSKIVFQANGGRATFFFLVTSNVGTFKIFGDVYGDTVKQQDASGKVCTVTNVGGMMQLNIAGLDNTNGYSSCTGVFRIL